MRIDEDVKEVVGRQRMVGAVGKGVGVVLRDPRHGQDNAWRVAFRILQDFLLVGTCRSGCNEREREIGPSSDERMTFQVVGSKTGLGQI